MTDKEKLYKAYSDIVWMAIRYAHGRKTYAPGMVRDSIRQFKEVFPDFKLKEDITIKEPENITDWSIKEDSLHDLFENE